MAYTIFENARLFDGVTPELQGPVSVFVAENEVKEISFGPVRGSSAERIDCGGKTLMPGLIDNHVHVYIESLKLAPPEPPITYRAQYARKFLRHIVSCGFTTVRDVAGGDHGLAMALRAGFLEGPRFYYGGLCLTQTGGHGDLRPMDQSTDACCTGRHGWLAVRADGVDECIRAAREELRKGASHIKIMGSGGIMSPTDSLEHGQYSESEIRAIVEECERRGAYACAHCYPATAIRRCVEFGVRCIEHGTLIDTATAEFVAAKGAYVVPTVAVMFTLLESGARDSLSEGSVSKAKRIQKQALEALAILRGANVMTGFGTDLIGEQHVQQCLELKIRARVLTPFEILHSATAINAQILQMDGRLGCIRPGALADLLVVDGDPLRDLSVLYDDGARITHIMIDGRFVKRLNS